MTLGEIFLAIVMVFATLDVGGSLALMLTLKKFGAILRVWLAPIFTIIFFAFSLIILVIRTWLVPIGSWIGHLWWMLCVVFGVVIAWSILQWEHAAIRKKREQTVGVGLILFWLLIVWLIFAIRTYQTLKNQTLPLHLVQSKPPTPTPD